MHARLQILLTLALAVLFRSVSAADTNPYSFLHGVASGDPTSSAVIIWTRVTPGNVKGCTQAKVTYIICEAESASEQSPADLFAFARQKKHRECSQGNVVTTADVDWTVKVDVTNLRSNAHFHYQFRVGTDAKLRKKSPVGRTRTLPKATEDVDALTYALFSCSHYGFGYFHAYELAASAEKLDFWIQSGDNIYEYGSYANYADSFPIAPSQGTLRADAPPYIVPEAVTLTEYRERHAIYKTDRGLQMMGRRAPAFIVFDDHEIANDATKDGAENHQPICPNIVPYPYAVPPTTKCDKNEGSWAARVDAATRAAHEWLPIRSNGTSAEARKDVSFEFHYGNLASFAGYDTRLRKRTVADPTPLLGANALSFLVATSPVSPADYGTDPAFIDAANSVKNDSDPNAEMLGEATRGSLRSHFRKSKQNGAPWQVYVSQTLMAQLFLGDLLKSKQTILADLQADAVGTGIPGALLAGLAAAYQNAVDTGLATSALFRLAQASASLKVPFSGDSWDAFATEREKVLAIFDEEAANAIVISGDSHNGWASELRLGDKALGVPVGVEFGGPSVSSVGIEDSIYPFGGIHAVAGPFKVNVGFDAVESSVLLANPSLKYINLKDRGFVLFSVTKANLTGEYVYVNRDRNERYNSNDVNTALLTRDAYNLEHYCDARLTTKNGDKGRFTVVESKKFLVPLACVSNYDKSFFDGLFAG